MPRSCSGISKSDVLTPARSSQFKRDVSKGQGIEPDWLVVYRVEGDQLQLARTGTHSDLFRE